MILTSRQILSLAQLAGFDIDPISVSEDEMETEYAVWKDKESGTSYAYPLEYPEEGMTDL